MKIVIGLMLLALMAFAAFGSAALTGLVNPATLTIKGSSTVLPVAQEEAAAFPTYWNTLVAANPSWGAHTVDTAIVPEGLGSGTAPTALIAGTADIGEMSRPLKSGASNHEYSDLPNAQLWCIGFDSVAIVTSPDMTWFPSNLNTQQVADLFAAHPSTGTPYVTYRDFFTAQGISTDGVPTAALDATIKRAVRDETSGTFDCWNTYFGKPNGIDFSVAGRVNLASNTFEQENINVYTDVSTGNLAQNTEYVGFISSGYLETYSDMKAINIAFNIANVPTSLITNVTPKVWSAFVQCTQDNVVYAISGTNYGHATGKYFAWRYLWEVTKDTIPKTGNGLEAGVWIAYMKKAGTTPGGSNFVADQKYIVLNRADMAGANMIDANLAPYTPAAGQTQTLPDGKCNFRDISYFVAGYIAYYTANTYNPYIDFNADGKCNFNDISAFVSSYVAYYTH